MNQSPQQQQQQQRRKFQKFAKNFEALISYGIEKKTLISYRYRIESKKSLSLFIGMGPIHAG